MLSGRQILVKPAVKLSNVMCQLQFLPISPRCVERRRVFNQCSVTNQQLNDMGILNYLLSKQGILKIVQLMLLLVAFACVRSTWYTSIYAYGFYEGVTLGYSITIILFMFLAVFGVRKRVSFVNWTIAEFVLDTLGFIFIATGSIVAAVKSYDAPILVAASVCGLLASYLLVGSVILSYIAAHQSQSADPPV